MSSCFFIVDEDFATLFTRNIKSIRNPDAVLKQFKNYYYQNSTPIVSIGQFHYVYIKRDYLGFISIIHRSDDQYVNLMTILSYLDQFYVLLKDYFDVQALDKYLILDNVLLVMELLDESMDFGIIQLTDSSVIKDYIRVKINTPVIAKPELDSDEEAPAYNLAAYLPKSKSDVYKMWKGINPPSMSTFGLGGKNNTKNDTFLPKGEEDDDENTYIDSYIAKTAIMPVSWRTKGIFYAKNEFFLDVIEKVQYLMDFPNQTIKKNLIHGEIRCRAYLSGMPKLNIALNKLLQNDEQFTAQVKFHQCVSLKSIDNVERTTESLDDKKEIEFIPPDGKFILCKYELKRHVKDPPIIKLSSMEIKLKPKKFKLQIHLTIETHFKKQNATSLLQLKFPLKHIFKEHSIDLTKTARFKCDSGQVLFNISDDFLLWELESIKGGNGENKKSMVAEFSLFNEELYLQQQAELKNSMNPPPLRDGPKLEEIYKQTHTADEVDDEEQKNEVNQTKLNRDQQLLNIKFEVPYSTCSGLKIEYLKIEEEQLKYQSFPWVRYKVLNDEEYAYVV